MLLLSFLVIRKELNSLKVLSILLLLPLSYLLSLPFAVSPQGAYDNVIKWGMYCAFFLLLYWSSFDQKNKKTMPVVFQFTGISISLLMLLVYYNFFSFPNYMVDGRFAGVFLHPNTFGMVMTLYFLFSISLLTKKSISLKILFFYATPIVPFFVCMVQSNFTGMLPFFSISWLIGLILLPFKKQVEYLLYSIISVACSIFAIKSMTSETGLLIILLMSLLSTFLIVLIKKVKRQKELNNENIYLYSEKIGLYLILTVFITSLCFLTLLDLKNEGLGFKTLPSKLQDTIQGLSINAVTEEHFISLKDVLNMSKDSPIIGFGGEGWATAYKSYQQSPYQSNEIYNGYLEWIIDTGWIGFSFFSIVFAILFYLTLKTYIKKQDSSLVAGSITALFTIFIHSFIDFDFSYGTIWFLVFWLFAMAIDIKHDPSIKRSNVNTMIGKRMVPIIVSILSILLIISSVLSLRFLIAATYFEKSKKNQSITMQKELLQKAVSNHPSNINYLTKLSNIYLQLAKDDKTKNYKIELNELITRMVTLEPENSSVLYNAAVIAKSIGENQKAILIIDEALKKDHYNTKLYEKGMQIKLQFALVENSNVKRKYANLVLDDYQEIMYWNRMVDNNQFSGANNNRNFLLTKNVNYYASLSYYLLKDYKKVINIYSQNKKLFNNDKRMIALTILALEKEGEFNQSSKLYLIENDSTETKHFVKILKKKLDNL